MNSFIKRTVLPVTLALSLAAYTVHGQTSSSPSSTSKMQAAAPDKAADIFPDPVVATGNGFQIKRSQVDDAFVNYNAGVEAKGGSIPDEQRDEVRSKLLDRLIISKILTQRATADDKANVKKAVDENIEEARKSAPSPEAFDAKIKASGLTLDQIRDRECEELLPQRVLQRETTNGITISDVTAKKFYDDNPDKFEVPEEVRVSHILISTLDPLTQRPLSPDEKKAKEKLAGEIRARVMAGEDFAKLVKQYSDDPGSKDKGGEYKFPRGQMVPEFEAAAFSLKTNQVSDLVETQFGYHIIKLLEKFPAKNEQFSEVKDKIKDYLVAKEAEKTLPTYLKKIKTEANVALIDQKPVFPMIK
jgi:peptidyl-prolyl cis-trans isomerase C